MNNHDSTLVADLGVHAAEQAWEQLFAISDTAPRHLRLAVLLASLITLQDTTSELIDKLRELDPIWADYFDKGTKAMARRRRERQSSANNR